MAEQTERIDGLHYEAYERMALKEMQRIAEEQLAQADGPRRCYVAHRLGWVPVGQASILIATSSPGREVCSRATLHILNEVKRRAPVWKRVVDPSDAGRSPWSEKSEAFWLEQTQKPPSPAT